MSDGRAANALVALRRRQAAQRLMGHEAPGLDDWAMALSPVPVLGDLAGLGAEAVHWATNPDSRTLGNAMLAGASVLPFVPPLRKAVDARIGKANKAAAGARRGSRPVAMTVEAVSPDVLQAGRATRREQEDLGDKLYGTARGHAGLPADAKTHKGWGAWGTEHNPLYAETYRPGGVTDLRENAMVQGPAESLANNLLQEGVGAHRWNPLPLNRARDATAIMLKLPKNASREMVEALNKRFGDSMVVAHRPDMNSVFLTPFDGRGPMPSRADLKAVVPGSKPRYGRADEGRDATLVVRSKAPGPMPSDVWDAYSDLDYRNLVETR